MVFKTKDSLKKLTSLSFLMLAIFPLLKENYISITIIFCSFLVVINAVIYKHKISIKKDILFATLFFWVVLIRELIFFEPSKKLIILHLSFLVLPLIFYFKPDYINEKIKNKSLLIFQISVVIQCLYFSFIFLKNNSFNQIFYISNENIPFFRDYVFRNAKTVIHSTYFSAYLLISFIISFLKLIQEKTTIKLNLLNLGFTILFIFIFSSRIIILTLFVLIIIIALRYLKLFNSKKRLVVLLLSLVLFTILAGNLFKNVLFDRFNEIKTEINKPVEGKYYNSTNIRVAILKCTIKLITEAPLLGYGNQVQKNLNLCYSENYKSDFYIKHTYNSHNYYLNLILYGGWLMLFIFVLYIFYIFLSIKHSFLAILILIQLLVVNITENYLSRQYGIMTFNYFIMMFIFFKDNHMINNK
jgi:hypothetical protein